MTFYVRFINDKIIYQISKSQYRNFQRNNGLTYSYNRYEAILGCYYVMNFMMLTQKELDILNQDKNNQKNRSKKRLIIPVCL